MGCRWTAPSAENGGGQFEINLLHVPDPLKAADDALYFKQDMKGIARKYELAASFMAKPFLDRSGNGFHVHFSLLDREGRNVFDNGTADGSEVMRHAVGGVLAMMRSSSLVFAPHRNSYRRLTPNAHVASEVSWGYETRAAAVRIPGGSNAARRVEHRVAGADANPYLVLAAVLGAALEGIETGSRGGPRWWRRSEAALPIDWKEAIEGLRAERGGGADFCAGAAGDFPGDEEAGAAGVQPADQRVRARDLPGDGANPAEGARLGDPTALLPNVYRDLEGLESG